MKKYLFLMSLYIIGFNQLWAQSSPEVVVTNGHVDQVTSVCFHPEEIFVATGSMDKSIKIWDKNLQQEFRTLNGHKSRIEKMAFSNNGKYLISLENLENLYVWSFPEGKLLHMLIDKEIVGFAISENNQDLYVSQDNDIVRYDITTGQPIDTFADINSNLIRVLPTSKPQLLVQTEGIKDLQIYDVERKEITANLVGIGDVLMASSVALAKEQPLVAASYAERKIQVWNWETQEIILDLDRSDLPIPPNLVFSPDGNILFLEELSLQNIFSYDISTKKERPVINIDFIERTEREEVKQRTSTGIYGLAISPDGSTIGAATTLMDTKQDYTVLQQTGVKFWSISSGVANGALFSDIKKINHLSVTSDNKYVLTTTLNTPAGLRLWNLQEGQIDEYFANALLVSANKNGDIIGIMEGSRLAFYAFPAFELINTKEISSIAFPMSISDDGTMAAYSTIDMKSYKPSLEVIDIKTGTVKTRINRSIGQTVAYLQLSPDNQYLLGGNYGIMSCWKVATGELLYEKELLPIYDFLDINAKTQTIAVSQVGELGQILEIDIATGAIKDTIDSQLGGRIYCGDFSEDSELLVLGQGNSNSADYTYRVSVLDWKSKEFVCSMEGHTSDVNYVDFSSDGKTVYSAAADGLVKMWNLEKCTNTATFIAMNEDNYLILSPDNFYKTSKNNLEGIGFRYKNRLYGIDQFDLQFNRPDKIAAQLGASKLQVRMYEKAYHKRLERNGIASTEELQNLVLPNLEITNRTQIPLTTTQAELSLNISAQITTGNLAHLQVYVNNVPLYQVNGQAITGKSYTKPLTIPLSTGKNKIQVVVISEQGLESPRATLNIEYKSAQVTKPDLYLVAIGVSEYADDNFNLKFAAKDAQDLTAQLKQSPQYQNIYTKTLFNEAATLENINTLKSFFEKSKINDHIIFYISAHGLLDDAFNYYLATYQVDFQDPSKGGLAYEKIEALLENVPARNRLIMIDACHSGEIDETETVVAAETDDDWGEDVFRFSATKSGILSIKPKAGLKNSFDYMKALFNDVSKNIGATIIAAAGGYEYALESEEWNNGVFTYALLEGIQSKNADQNKDNKITISELKNYVTEQVTALTNGEQVPTTRKENLVNDFQVW